MTNKMPKAAYQILFGFLIMSFTVIACNSKKEEKKDVSQDTTIVKPDTLRLDTMEKVDTKPVKDPPPPPPAPTP